MSTEVERKVLGDRQRDPGSGDPLDDRLIRGC